MMNDFIDIFFRSVFLENLALAYFLGMCTSWWRGSVCP